MGLGEIKIPRATFRPSFCLVLLCALLSVNFFLGRALAQTRPKQTQDTEQTPSPPNSSLPSSSLPVSGTTIDGPLLYAKMCAHCHGPSGVPPENITKLLTPAPSDLTSQKYKHGDSEKEIAESIRQGIGSNMLRFKERLSEEQISAVTKFVITLKGAGSSSLNEDKTNNKNKRESFD